MWNYKCGARTNRDAKVERNKIFELMKKRNRIYNLKDKTEITPRELYDDTSNP